MIEPAENLFRAIEQRRCGLEHIDDAEKAKEVATEMSGAIRDRLDDADLLIQDSRFAELYEQAAEIAGETVRLAAVARQGMIRTEGGEHGTGKED